MQLIVLRFCFGCLVRLIVSYTAKSCIVGVVIAQLLLAVYDTYQCEGHVGTPIIQRRFANTFLQFLMWSMWCQMF